eukprot:GHVN01021280.1.p1 GENE.GHVN01021280.1~~GHVN01021280.1.p1  ORF type:complete len:380 (+),score=61.59 GHVN01021280.1:103-1242(+)
MSQSSTNNKLSEHLLEQGEAHHKKTNENGSDGNGAHQSLQIQSNSSPEESSSPPIKDYRMIRKAYEMGEVEASKALHVSAYPRAPRFQRESLEEPDRGPRSGHSDGGQRFHEEKHAWTDRDTLKAAIFGGLDGIVTIFAVVAGCVGANLTAPQIVIVGLGNLLADAVSMGFGEYVSSKAEIDLFDAEKARETWEVENVPACEQDEMIELYMHRWSFTQADAEKLVSITWKYPEFFVNHMMAEELGLLGDDGSGASPVKRGIVMFSSFAFFGIVPLVTFIAYLVTETSGVGHMHVEISRQAFYMAALASLVTLFILGVFKASLVGQKGQSQIMSGGMMVLNGTISGSLAYGVGTALQVRNSSLFTDLFFEFIAQAYVSGA